MSNCNCCGTCKFPCCSNQSVKSNVCYKVNESRIIESPYKTTNQRYNVNVFYGENLPDCGVTSYVQYKYREFPSIVGGIDISSQSISSPVIRASKVNIYIDSTVTFGSGDIKYYLLFPSILEYENANLPCNPNENYLVEYGFGVEIGNANDIVNYTYDFSDVTQYRRRVWGNNSASSSFGGYYYIYNIDFGDFGLCSCCDLINDINILQASNSDYSFSQEAGRRLGSVVAVCEEINFPPEADTQLSTTLLINSARITYDRPIPESAIKIMCPAMSTCVEGVPGLYSYRNDYWESGQKANMNGWGNIISTPANETVTDDGISDVDNLQGIICPQIQSESVRNGRGLSDCKSEINSEVGTSPSQIWISVKNVLDLVSDRMLPIQLQDLDSDLLYELNQESDIKTANGIDFAYPFKGQSPISDLSLGYLLGFATSNPNNYTFTCANINNTNEDFMNFELSYLKLRDDSSLVANKLYYFNVSARVMDPPSLSCDTVPNSYCGECFSVNVNDVGDVSKIFRLYVTGSWGTYNVIYLTYDSVTQTWQSENICRTLRCNSTLYGVSTVNYELSFVSGDAHLTVTSSGYEVYSRTFISPNNGDCRLATNSIAFLTNQDSTSITTTGVANCTQYSSGTLQQFSTTYLLVPLHLVYPNNR